MLMTILMPLLQRYGDKAQIAFGVFQTQKNGLSTRFFDLVDAFGDIIRGCHGFLCNFNDHVTDANAFLCRGTDGIDLKHDDAFDLRVE